MAVFGLSSSALARQLTRMQTEPSSLEPADAVGFKLLTSLFPLISVILIWKKTVIFVSFDSSLRELTTSLAVEKGIFLFLTVKAKNNVL